MTENNWNYVGCGWFRAAGYQKGVTAPIIHAPELIEQLYKQIAELENEVESLYEQAAGEDI